MEGQTPMLAFRGARLAIEPSGGLTAPVTLTLAPGALVLADLRGPLRRQAFADAACGLLPPAEGAVLFQGRRWEEVTDEHGAAMRGRIGRLFGRDSWLPELSVEDTILLAPRYHTRRPDRALREEAARLAAAFGLPGLPVAPPTALTAAELHRAGLVRAFLNDPALVILEDPLGIDAEEILPPLMGEIRKLRDRGGAVLWLTQGSPAAIERSIPATERLRLAQGALLAVTDRAA
jgi:phospholipid/cholesterol/gamma-HCH transport system ATP-binding protein